MHGNIGDWRPHRPHRETRLGVFVAGACLVLSFGFVMMLMDKPRINLEKRGETPRAILPSPIRLQRSIERIA